MRVDHHENKTVDHKVLIFIWDKGPSIISITNSFQLYNHHDGSFLWYHICTEIPQTLQNKWDCSRQFPEEEEKSLEIYFRGKVINERTNSPGKRCMRTLTILSSELKTKLQRQTISAHANGPCRHIWKSRQLTSELLPQKKKKFTEFLLTSANEKQTMKNFSFLGYRRRSIKKIVLA